MPREESHIATLDRRIQQFTASASEIHEELSSGNWSSSIESRLDELIKIVEKCGAARENLGLKNEYPELDRQAVKIWNLSTSLIASEEDSPNIGTVLKARILSFFMLDCAQPSTGWTSHNVFRIFKASLMAGTACIDHKQLNWAFKIMERAAKIHEKLQQLASENADERDFVKKLERGYFLLRMKLAWKQSNLAVADFMYTKLALAEASVDTSFSEELAGVLLAIGNDLSAQKVHDAAIKWLKRAFELLGALDPVCYGEAANELRLVVMYSLGKACISGGGQENFDCAESIINSIIEEWPTNMAGYLLKLELLTAQQPHEIRTYHDVLLRIISRTQLTDTIFDTIMGKIRHLETQSIPLACNCVDELVITRLVTMECEKWIEKAFITRLWMTAKEYAILSDGSGPQALKRLLDCMAKHLVGPLSPKATHGAQILLWKTSEALYLQEKYDKAGEWCEVALHPIFNKSGELNQAKISRRIIYCAINQKDYAKAREMFQTMSEGARKQPATMFLMHMVAVRTSDAALAESSIRGIAESSTEDYRILYACALDAQTVGHRRETLRALKYLLRKCDSLSQDCINIPAALRCTIRLTIEEIKSSEGGEISNTESLCRIFELAAEHADKERSRRRNSTTSQSILFTVKELEWFSRTAYNLGLLSIEKWHPSTSLRIIQTCIKFLGIYPDDVDTTTKTVIQVKGLFCYFLMASLHIELARNEDQNELRLQQYIHAESHIQHYRSKKEGVLEMTSEEAAWDVKEKFATLLLYDFEASIHLTEWDTLGPLIDEAVIFGNTNTLQYLGDMLLRSQAPDRVLMPAAKKILDNMIPKDDADMGKLAKCIRCQVQLSLIRDPKITEELLVQVVTMIREAKSDRKYPDVELHWLATAVFISCLQNNLSGKKSGLQLSLQAWNRAIEFKCVSDRERYRRFAELGLSLAKPMDDGGRLLTRLQKKFLRDAWES